MEFQNIICCYLAAPLIEMFLWIFLLQKWCVAWNSMWHFSWFITFSNCQTNDQLLSNAIREIEFQRYHFFACICTFLRTHFSNQHDILSKIDLVSQALKFFICEGSINSLKFLLLSGYYSSTLLGQLPRNCKAGWRNTCDSSNFYIWKFSLGSKATWIQTYWKNKTANSLLPI